MEYWKCLWVVMVAFLLGGSRWWECEGCWEHEKTALLQLKPFFGHIEDVEKSWVEGNQSWDCCEWERVECNNSTGRVIQLFLNLTYTEAEQDIVYTSYADYSWSISNWHLNASLFLPFKELKGLYLSGNSIAGCVDNQGFERLSFNLDKLEFLDLSSNHFSDSILASLSELSSLKSLNLGSNQFGSSNLTDGIQRLSKLNKLETLDLSGNTLLGSNFLSHLIRFTSLKTLRLQSCGLKGTIDILEFNNLKNLKELYLGSNEIESFRSLLQNKREMRLTKLEVLGLSDNLFNNSIFSSLVAFSNLKSLYIGNNTLKGAILIKELNALSNLEELYMRENEVNEFAPSLDYETELRLMNLKVLDLNWNLFNNSMFSSLASLSNLKFLYLFGNQLEGKIDFRGLHVLKNLEELDISCSFAEDTACSFPLESLGIFRSLRILFLCRFSFYGTMTIQRWQNSTNLEELVLYDSSLSSNFIQDIETLTSLKSLYAYHCEFNGSLNLHELYSLKNLKELTISCSSTEGTICSISLQSMEIFQSLKTLSLDGFNISMTIKRWQNLTSLEELSVEYSSLPSNFIQGVCELRQLQKLIIFNNNLKAELPECFSNLTSLEYLDLSENQLFGSISIMKSLISLQELGLSYNNFQIPISLGPLFNLSKLERIHADNNAIYAETEKRLLAPTFQLRSISLSCCGDVRLFPQFLFHQHDLEDVYLSNIYFKEEQFPNWLLENNRKLKKLYLYNNSLLAPFRLPIASHLGLLYLDVSTNSFSGNIPKEIGAKLPSLVFLNMSNNYFDGRIPVSVGDMNFLNHLDLSNNKLTGGIPKHLAMGNMSSLQEIILANNHLEGPIPTEFC